MTAIGDVAARIRSSPAPVLIVDTCTFLDLFRPDETSKKARVPAEEVEAAAELLKLATKAPAELHLIVPELVPIEFRDHANAIEELFVSWQTTHEANRQWFERTATAFGLASPAAPSALPSALPRQCRQLAENLLAAATVLAREQSCLDRAVVRLISKRRPSHAKEIKDSMNLEQALELCRQLAVTGTYPHPIWFVSSNVNDFGVKLTSEVHADLKSDFDSVGLTYLKSLRVARGILG